VLIPLIQLGIVAIVAWLPGAVLFRLPIGERRKRAALDAGERLFWVVIISLAVSLSLVLAMAAIGRYSLNRLLVADIVIALLLSGAARFQLTFGADAPRPGSAVLLPATLVLLGAWLFFPPAEYVIGGKDPGGYMNEGIQIAQRGTFAYHDPVVASVPEFARDLFFPSHQRPDYYGLRFMGFFISNPDTGLVIGQFPHLFPASIAVAHGIDGLTGARRTAGMWAILGLLAVYFAGARLVGRAAAFAGAALLAVNVVQVWFARYPNAEVVMQALLFAALLATARAYVDGDRFFAPVAGYLLGLLLFLRVDAALGIVAVLAGVALHVVAGGRWQPLFFLPLGGLAALATWYLAGPMRAYTDRSVTYLTTLRGWQYAVIVTVTLAAAGVFVWCRRSRRIAGLITRLAPTLLGASLVVLAVYALYFRHPSGKLAEHDAYALRLFTDFYLTLPALIASLLGLIVVSRQAFWRAPEFFVTYAAFCVFFFYKIRIVPEHFWMARRFLAVALPGALLFAATTALGTRAGPRLTRPIRGAVGGLFVLILGSQYLRATRPILDHVEYRGVIPRLEQLARSIEDDDLVIVETRTETDIHTLAVPLAYTYARNVLVFSSALPDKETVAKFLDWARGRYRRVLFMGSGGTDLLSARWSVKVLDSERFRVPEYDSPVNGYPRFPRSKQFDYTLYEFGPPVDTVPDGPFNLDIGIRDDLNVLRFHAKEETEGRTFRWSRDVSYVIVTTVHAGDREITLWLSDGGRPAAAPPADVAVQLGGHLLGSVRVTTGFKPYSLGIPPDAAAALAAANEPVRLRLSTTVWSPGALIGTPDDRQLGVMVDRVAVQ
jgi:hypothetical protein